MAQTLPITTKAQATRQRILETAAGMFWRRSFHGVAIDDVAVKSGVNKATIYRYYLDKAELALAAVVYNGESVIADIFEPVFARHDTPDDRLAAIYTCLYHAHRRFAEQEGDMFGCPIASLALELGQDIPEVREEAHRIFSHIESYLLEIAKGAVKARENLGWQPPELARMLVQLLHGAFTSARLAREAERVLDAGNASLTLIGSATRLHPEGENAL